MGQVRIDCLNGSLKSAFRNLKSAILVSPLLFALSLVGALLFALRAPTDAQQPTKAPHIGYLSLRSGIEPREEAFLKGLRELGYIEGQNLVIDWRFAKGREDRLPELASELVQLKVDVIIAAGAQASQVVKRATTTIPIVIGQVGSPIQQGLVASLARPGGNITGFSNINPDLAGKRLELLKETVPKASRVVFLFDPRNPGTVLALRETEAAAPAFGVRLQSVEVRRPDDLENGFQAARKGRAEAVIVQASGVLITGRDRTRIADLAVKALLPTMHVEQAFVLAGGLMSYGTDVPEQFRRAAVYVDKILKGTKPADLPVEQPMKFELVINLKTAKQIGLTIPPNVLARADRVIR
jgi:putative tryptophan/tyrosine transport system substrate-binding protein